MYNILIVDDIPENLTVLRQMLTEHGYRVRPALSGEMALKAAQIDIPDLILLDIMMPEMDGFEVCKRLKADDAARNVPVLFISALSDTSNKIKGFQAGGMDYITKPFHIAEVLARVETHITLSRLQKEMQDQNRLLLGEIEERKKIEKTLEKANRELEHLASLDGLTHIANRRQFDTTLARQWKRLSREKKPLSLIFSDIDFFKQFNDQYGHVAGDECLKEVAQAIASVILRPMDIAARYGGEEFAVVMPDTDHDGAVLVAGRIRNAIQNLAIPHSTSQVSPIISLSMGVVTMTPNSKAAVGSIILAADNLLYQAKAAGRDRILSQSQSQ